MKRRPPAQARNDGRQQVELGKRVAIPGNEQHRHFDARKMLGAFDPRLACGVKRETEEGEALHVRKRRLGLRLRCHPPTERPASGEQGQSRSRAAPPPPRQRGRLHVRALERSGRFDPFSM